MDTQMMLLASARQTAARRAADDRRAGSVDRQLCRRWMLGFIPVSQACPAA